MPPLLTLVALHGNGGGAFRFARVEPFVPADVRFRPVTLPGFASVPRDPTLTTLRAYAERLRGWLLAERRPRVLLGHGIVGSIALELAQFASRLGSRLLPRLMALPGARSLGRWAFSTRLLRPFWRRRLFSRPVPRDYTNRFFAEYRACSVFAQMFELVTPDWFASLRPVPVKAALLWGERERVLTVDQLEAFRALLPGCFVSLPGRWDHFPMIEEPEAYAREVSALARKLAVR
jgi:pimeloyl-ACP methyl ester carboxylesterase